MSSAAPITATPAAKPRRWRRLAWRALLLLIALRVLLALALMFAATPVLRLFGVHANWSSLSLSIRDGALDLRDVEVALGDPTVNGVPMLRAARAAVDIDMLQLLRGTLSVRAVELDSAYVQFTRSPASAPTTAPAAVATSPAPSTSPTERAARTLSLPFAVHALRAHDLRLHVVDAALPGGAVDLTAQLTVTDLGVDDAPAQVLLVLTSPQALDQLRVTAHVATGELHAAGDAALLLRGLRPAAIAPWLAALGIVPDAKRLDADLSIDGQGDVDPAQRTLAPRCTATVKLAMRADDVETVAIDRLELTTGGRTATTDDFVAIAVRGVRAAASRGGDGRVRALGLAFAPMPAGPAPVAAPQAANAPPAPPRDLAVQVRDLQATWRDELGALRELPLEIAELDYTPPTGTAGGIVHLQAHLSELANRVNATLHAERAADGALRTGLEFTATGVTLQRLRPLLAAAGIEPTFASGDIAFALDASAREAAEGTHAEFALHNLRIADGDRAFTLARVAAEDVAIARADGAIAVQRLLLEGPRAEIVRRGDGSIEVAGLRIGGPTAASSAASPSPPAAPAGSAPPRIVVEQIAWTGATCAFRDETLPTPYDIALDSIAMRGKHLVLTGARADDAVGALELDARAADRLAGLKVRATLQPGVPVRTLDVDLTATGLQPATIAPWLAAARIEPAFTDGNLHAHARASFGALDGSLDAALTQVAWRDGERELAAVDDVTLQGLRTDAGTTAIAALTIAAPRARVQRLADGSLIAAGLRLPPPAPTPPTTPSPTPTPTPTPTPAPASSLRIERFELRDAAVAWQDALAAVDTSVQVAVRTTALHVAAGAAASPFEFDVKLGARNALAFRGMLRADPNAPALAGHLAGRGLAAAEFAPYLPANLQVTLTDGSLDADLDASAAPVAEGGRNLAASVRALRLVDGTRELLALRDVAFTAPRIDVAANVLHVGEVLATGLRGELRQDANGIEIAGLRLAAAVPPLAAPTALTAIPAEAPPPRTTAADRAPPHWQLDRLELGLDDFRIVDATAPDAVPLQLSLTLANSLPWASDAKDPPHSPPLLLRLQGTALPLCAVLTGEFTAHVLAIEPRLVFALQATGLDTTRLLAVRPSLAGAIAGGDLTRGEFTLRGEVELDLHRRRSDQFAFGAPFGLDLEITECALRPEPGAPALLGIEGIEAELPLIDPRSGDVRAQSIRVRTPMLRAHRATDGLHIAGIVLAPTAPGTDASKPAVAPAPPQPTNANPPELRAGELLISGLDVHYTDATVDPPVDLPLTDLDIAIERFTTAAVRRAEPFHFAVSLNGGKVGLPKRRVSSSLLAGVVSAATSVVTGGDQEAVETRALFDELRIDGHLQLWPLVEGQVRASLSGFELPALRGLAKGNGVEIGDGLLDAGMRVDLRGNRGVDVGSTLAFTHLSLSEPPGGPISTWLKLPAPIDTVLFVLRNDQDEQRIPLQLHLDRGQVDPDAITNAAVSALGAVVRDAVTKSPLRAASMVTGLFGLGGGPIDLTRYTRALPFAPGAVELPSDATAQLDDVLGLLRGDPGLVAVLTHTLGTDDAATSSQLASPPHDVAMATAARLQAELAVAADARAELAATAQTTLGAGLRQESLQALRRLQEFDRATGATAQALDQALALQKPGADRRAPARARAFATQLGQERLRRVRELLLEQLGPGGKHRIELRPARGQPGNDAAGALTVSVARRAQG